MIALKSIELTVNIIQMCTCECVCAFSNHYHGNEFVLGKKAKKKKKKKEADPNCVYSQESATYPINKSNL